MGAWDGTDMALTKTHKVTLQSETEADYADALRSSYGCRDFSDLVRFLIKKEAKEMTLVKNHLDKIKKESSAEGRT